MSAEALSPVRPPIPVAPPAVRVRDAVVSYDRRPVLRRINLDIGAGEVVAVLGPNGSGKSTLLRAVLGLVPLTGGSVELHGTSLHRFREWARIGYVPQRLSAGGGVPATVREVVASGQVARRRRLSLPTAEDRKAVTEALETVDLVHRSRDSVHELSGGQQQRVLIARALAGRPDTFLMDEPLAGVDAASQQTLADTIAALSRRGATVILVLHELGPLEPLIERGVVLSQGIVGHDGVPPRPFGDCARQGHEHIHPHADEPGGAPALPAIEVPRRD